MKFNLPEEAEQFYDFLGKLPDNECIKVRTNLYYIELKKDTLVLKFENINNSDQWTRTFINLIDLTSSVRYSYHIEFPAELVRTFCSGETTLLVSIAEKISDYLIKINE